MLTTDRSRLEAVARRAMLGRGFAPDVPDDALAQVEQLQEPARDGSVADLRDLPWCSIDNDDSRDLDQLTACEPGDDGALRVLVAVADVDALVPKASPVDRHAAENTTSVYTPAHIFAMLPERLSTDLTSLNEHEDRLAIVVAMSVDAHGTPWDTSIRRARVRNRAQLAYDAVGAWLEDEAPPPPALARVDGLDEALRSQDRVARRLRRARHEEGALTLDTIQVRAGFDGDEVTDLEERRRHRATELIEELMIAANGVTARFLRGEGRSALRRIVRPPERWQRLVELADSFGETLPEEPDSRALAGFLDARKEDDPLRFPDLSLTVVKLVGRGEYAVVDASGEGPGHFGLAVRDYTHSTAPNRRYADLITQRQVKAALSGAPDPYSGEELASLALRCTARAAAADKVERLTGKAAAACLLGDRVGDRFDAVVTGASTKGTWVRILHPSVEGRLVRGWKGLDVGDRVRVKLLATDVERGYIDFRRA